VFALPYGRATDKCVLNVCRAPAANFHKVVIMVCKLEFRCLNFKFYWFHILLFMLQRSVEHLTVIYSVRNWYQQSAKFLETVLRFNRTRSLPCSCIVSENPAERPRKRNNGLHITGIVATITAKTSVLSIIMSSEVCWIDASTLAQCTTFTGGVAKLWSRYYCSPD